MKKRFSLGKRALALALSMVMCVGMLQVTAFAEDGTTTDSNTDIVETGDENNGSSTTTTTIVETTVKTDTTIEGPVKGGPTTTVGDSKETGSKTESNDLFNQSNTTEQDLSFEASGTIKLNGGSGSGTVNKEVTAEDVAKELGWTCENGTSSDLGENGEEIKSETVVKNENGAYSVESTKTTTEKIEGEKHETGKSEVISKNETTDVTQTPGVPSGPVPVGDSTEEVKLPEPPTAGTTTHEDGTSTVVRVEDVTDENNVTTGYIVITEERDAEGNVTSTKTENVSGTHKVEKTESVVVDKTTNTTTTETKTKVEEVKEDKVITTTQTVRNEVAVCEDKNKLSANIKIELLEDDKAEELGQDVVLSKDDVVSADVSIKQTSGSSNEVTADITFNLAIKQGAKPEDLQVEVIQYTGELDWRGEPVYVKLGAATVKGGNDGKSGTISFSGLNLATGQTQKITFDISYGSHGYEGDHKEFAGLIINMEVDNIQTISASAKQTNATTKKEDVTTTNYEREDVTVETEATTTVTTTTTTKTTTTDTVNRDWSTETPDPDDTTPGGTTPGGTTPGGTTPGGTTPGGTTPGGDDDDNTSDPVVVPETDVPLVEEPDVEIPEEEVPLAEEPEVEIPEEEVPLAEVPEELVIEDENVPLADVPKTGDISSLWYLTTLLSACGLALLGLRKKDNI